MKSAGPAFFCIGAQKAGTSWLFEQLIRHPGIWLPPIKELHYFDHVHLPENRIWTLGHIRKGALQQLQSQMQQTAPDWTYVSYLADMAARQPFSEEWYLRCFDRPRARDRIRGDVTPSYCAIGEAGIRHLLETAPDAKIIYIIREPVQRALSQLRMNVARQSEPSTEPRLIEMCKNSELLHRGDYRSYVPLWRAAFAPSRILFLPYGDLRINPTGFMRRIEEFLDVDRFDGYALGAKVHETKRLEIPASVVEHLSEVLAAQGRFIEAEFGSDFHARTR